MKKTLFTGLAILLPIAVTVFVIVFFVDLLTAPFVGGIEQLLLFLGKNAIFLQKHRTLLLIISKIIVLFFLFILILVLGYLGKKFFFSFLIKQMHRLFLKIPFVKRIFKVTLDITQNIFKENKDKIFQQSVVIPFPSEHSFALGFLTGEAPMEADKKKNPDLSPLKTIFVPTSPHPVSGFLLMFPDKHIQEVDISTENVFKFLISCGLYEEKKGEENGP